MKFLKFLKNLLVKTMLSARRTLAKRAQQIDDEIKLIQCRLKSEAGAGPGAVNRMLDLEGEAQGYRTCIRWLDAKVERLRTDRKSSEFKPGEAS